MYHVIGYSSSSYAITSVFDQRNMPLRNALVALRSLHVGRIVRYAPYGVVAIKSPSRLLICVRKAQNVMK